MKFKGWIPTVTGRLSFDLFGDTKYPSRAISRNVSDSFNRYAIIYQKRILSDATIPGKEKAARLFFKLEGKFWCVCLAKNNDFIRQRESPLEGRLLIFHDRNIWRDTVEKLVRRYQADLFSYTKKVHPPSLSSLFESKFQTLCTSIIKYSSFSVDFVLERNGIATITPCDPNLISPEAPALPTDLNGKKYFLHIVCSQLFFFLRDIGHTHQHHNDTTDTIVDLYPIKDDDDVTWRNETFRSMSRKALTFKRSKREDEFTSALGVLAYISSFRTITCQMSNHAQHNLPKFDEKSLEKAIKAGLAQKKFLTQQTISRLDKARNFTISLIGIFLSVLSLYKVTDGRPIKMSDESKELYDLFISGIINHPILSIASVPIIFILGAIITKTINPVEWKTLRGILKLLLTLNRKVAFVLSLLLMLLILTFTVWFVYIR